MKTNKRLNWIDSAGGPLIVMERKSVHNWLGSSGTRVNVEENITDYDRACNVDDYVGVIIVGQEQALVLNDEPMQTVWWKNEDNHEGLLVRWQWAGSEDDVIHSLEKLDNIIWENTGLKINFSEGNLIMFDSACRYDEIDLSSSIKVQSGTHHILTAFWQPNESISLVLHRFEDIKL